MREPEARIPPCFGWLYLLLHIHKRYLQALKKMKTNILHSLLLGLIFCVGQSFGESILGFLITNVRRTSDVNFEGVIMFMWIRIALTIIPYLAVFVTGDLITKEKMRPSLMSLGLNIIILIYFYNRGLIQKDPISFIIGSLLTSLILILIDRKLETREYFQKRRAE